ncbi:MAG: imidazoleglycerol-phosphate dehydratase HisB [Ignavibacteria bacterium]|nr:imidazoleglycerol-phosphate dehydratase HisB [Ignavibacteria bacterium]
MKVKIEKALFDIKNAKSKGLISGLKKLSERGYLLLSDADLGSKDFLLNDILKLENISVKKAGKEKFDYFISDKKRSNSENTIVISDSINDFLSAAEEIIKSERSSLKKRKTKETDITIETRLDGNGLSQISTGVGFFDHMLEQISKHGNIDLKINVKGDLHVDEHHTVEDVGITLGEALLEALGTKKGIKRYGYFIPMDESVSKCTIDLGGRTYLNFKCRFEREKVGDFPTELTEEFFRGLASGLKANIYIRAKGKNDHHKIEAMFKVFAKALNEACRIDERTNGALPSTKGML